MSANGNRGCSDGRFFSEPASSSAGRTPVAAASKGLQAASFALVVPGRGACHASLKTDRSLPRIDLYRSYAMTSGRKEKRSHRFSECPTHASLQLDTFGGGESSSPSGLACFSGTGSWFRAARLHLDGCATRRPCAPCLLATERAELGRPCCVGGVRNLSQLSWRWTELASLDFACYSSFLGVRCDFFWDVVVGSYREWDCLELRNARKTRAC